MQCGVEIVADCLMSRSFERAVTCYTCCETSSMILVEESTYILVRPVGPVLKSGPDTGLKEAGSLTNVKQDSQPAIFAAPRHDETQHYYSSTTKGSLINQKPELPRPLL